MDCSGVSNTRGFRESSNPAGGYAFTAQPADQPDAGPGSQVPMYFINAIWSSGNDLVVRSIKKDQSGTLYMDPGGPAVD